MRPSEQRPPNTELTDTEKKEYSDMIDNYNRSGALSFEQTVLVRNRLDSLNASSKRLEIESRKLSSLTSVLIFLTVVLAVLTALSVYKTFT
jgi:hypothetical protein